MINLIDQAYTEQWEYRVSLHTGIHMGHDNEQNLSLEDIKAGPESDTLLDPDLTMECMQFTMGYYITLSRIVSRKFEHAQKAIEKRMRELQAEEKSLKAELKHAPAPFDKIKKYKALGKALNQLSDALEVAQLSAEELEQVQEIFALLPGKIKVYFDTLVSLDEELIEMMKEISSEEYVAAYKRAQKIIDLVQDGKNVLSGNDVAEERTLYYNVKEILQPLKAELTNMKHKRDGYRVLPDGTLIRDL